MFGWIRRRRTDSDQNHHLRAAREGHPHLGARERARADTRLVTILSLVALFVAAGLWYYSKDREMVASDGTVQTTGSGARDVPRPNPSDFPAPSPQQQ